VSGDGLRAGEAPPAGVSGAWTGGGRASDTRGRILDAAVSLFGEHGYAGTSVRDIAERLGLTKAALYYHFPSKETILDALLDPFVTELTRIVELVRGAPPPEPRAIIELMAGLLAGPGSILCAFVNDPSVLHRKIGEEDVFSCSEEVVQALAGPDPTPAAVVRARCALGAVQSGVLGADFHRRRAAGRSPADADNAQDTAPSAGHLAGLETPDAAGVPVGWPPHTIVAADMQAVIVDAALAALAGGGHGPDPAASTARRCA